MVEQIHALTDRTGDMARNHKAGGQGEPHAARMGELLPSRHRQQGVSGTRQLHSDAVAPVVAVQAQNQASQGRDLSTLASLRALWARTPEQAWARRAVGEGVRFCPRAGCVMWRRHLCGVSLRWWLPAPQTDLWTPIASFAAVGAIAGGLVGYWNGGDGEFFIR